MKESTAFNYLNTEQVKNLSYCLAVCKACAKMCIEEGHKKTAVICNECADICDVALKFTCANSEFKDPVLELCSQVCKRCADECNKMSVAHCKECGAMCKKCAETCSPSGARKY